MAVKIELAAVTRRGQAGVTNEDAVGVNGWALWATEPPATPTLSPAALILDLGTSRHSSFVVADGLGGLLGAQQASLVVAESLSGQDIRDWASLTASLNRAHRRLLEIQRARPEVGEMGAAFAGVTVDASGAVACFNVGDCRVYFANAGTLVQASRDDTEPIAFTSRSRLTRWVGQAGVDQLEPYVRRLEPAQVRRILVCSDGLYTSAGIDALEATLCDPNAQTSQALAQRLLDSAGGATDDASAVVLQVIVSETPSSQQRR